MAGRGIKDPPWWVTMPTRAEVILQPRGEGEPKTEHCVVCGNAIRVQIFKGLGVCGEAHRKIRDDVPTGDTGTRGWYHTCAKNLRNHHGHKVRFTLPDPWTIYEGTIGHVNFGEEHETIEFLLVQGYTTLMPGPPGSDRQPVEHEEEQYIAELTAYKVVEVQRCGKP